MPSREVAQVEAEDFFGAALDAVHTGSGLADAIPAVGAEDFFGPALDAIVAET